MSNIVPFVVAIITDLVAITVLAYVLYFRRHRRRDLLLAFTALNTGIMAVTIVLSTASAGVGLGLGLFGILSIIRLRSDQITQQEIAYYFVSLVLGLVAGLHPASLWVVPMLSALMILVMWIVDSPAIAPRARRTRVTMDRTYAQESELILALESMLGGEVMRIEVEELDAVRDTTVVDVRYRVREAGAPLTGNTNRIAQLVSK